MALPVPAGTGAYAALPPAAMKGEMPVGYYYTGGAAPPAQLTFKTIVVVVVVVIVALAIFGWFGFHRYRRRKDDHGEEEEPKNTNGSKLKSSRHRLEEAQRVREQQINEIRARVEREHASKVHQHHHQQQQHGASTGNRLVVPPAPASRAQGVEQYVPFSASAGSSNSRGPQYAGVAASNTRATRLVSDFGPANGDQKQGAAELEGAGGGGSSVFDTVWGARQSSGEAPTASAKRAKQGAAGGDDDDDDEGLTRFMPNMADAVDGKDKDTNMSLFTPERLKMSNRMSGQIGGGESGGGGEDQDDFLAKQREAGSGMKKLGKYSQLDQGRAQSIRDQYASQGARGDDVVVFNGSEYL